MFWKLDSEYFQSDDSSKRFYPAASWYLITLCPAERGEGSFQINYKVFRSENALSIYAINKTFWFWDFSHSFVLCSHCCKKEEKYACKGFVFIAEADYFCLAVSDRNHVTRPLSRLSLADSGRRLGGHEYRAREAPLACLPGKHRHVVITLGNQYFISATLFYLRIV